MRCLPGARRAVAEQERLPPDGSIRRYTCANLLQSIPFQFICAFVVILGLPQGAKWRQPEVLPGG